MPAQVIINFGVQNFGSQWNTTEQSDANSNLNTLLEELNVLRKQIQIKINEINIAKQLCIQLQVQDSGNMNPV